MIIITIERVCYLRLDNFDNNNAHLDTSSSSHHNNIIYNNIQDV